jgi:hypothetical protein
MLEWFQNPAFSIAFAVGLMFFGYFFGLFEGRGQGYKRRKAEEAENEETDLENEPLPLASPPSPSDETPMLNLSMDEAGQLRLKLDGQKTDTSALDAGQRKRLIEIITRMRPWLETRKTTPPPQPQPRSGREPNGAIRPAPSPQGASSSQRTPPPQTVSSSKATPAPSSAARGERITAPPDPDKDEEEEPAPETQSIVAQIDSILQARLAGTPLAEKGVRLQESPEGGVLVWVGLNKYEGIEDVPDEGIKAALKGAVAEWEDKFTPGG